MTSEDTSPLYGLQVYHDVAQAMESLKAEAEQAGLEMWVYTGDPTKLPAASYISTPSGPGLWIYAVPWGPEMVASVKKMLDHTLTPEGAAAMRLPRTLPTPSVSLLDPEYAPSDIPPINTVPGYEKLVNYLSSAVHPNEVPHEMVFTHITPDNILLVTLEVLRSRSTENPQPTEEDTADAS